MRRFFKLLFILVGGLLALVLVAILAISLFFDPNDHKDRVRDMVREQTGRELTIEGDIEMSYFPWLGVEAGPATLSNAGGFGPRPFAHVERVGVKVKLLPLIRRQVEIDTIVLEGADINLARNASGMSNWQDLVPEGQQTTDTEAAGTGIAGLVISGVQLRNSTVSWNDAQAGTNYTARGIDLETSEVSLGSPFDLRMGFDLASDTSGLDARVSLEATPTVGADFQRAELDGFEFSLNGNVGDMPLDVTLRADAAVDLAAGTAELSDLVIDAWNVSASGSGRVTGLNADLEYQANLAVAEFSPRELIENLTGSEPETSDEDVLQSAAASLDVTGDAGSAELKLARAHLDDTEIIGDFNIVSFAPLATRFNLDISAIDVDRYLSPAQQEASSDTPLATPGEAAAAGSSLIPVETLRGLDTRGRIHADEFKVAGLTASDINININAGNGLVRIHPLEADFYRGKYTGDIRIDARGARPTLNMNERVQGVSAGPLLQDAAGRSWMTGMGGLSLSSTADLSSPEAAKNSLSGEFSLDLSNGAIFGINIAQRIRQAAALLQGESVSLAADEQKTDFSSFVINATMNNGVINADTVRLSSPILEITGGGKISLANNSVDLSFRPVLKGALEGAGGETMNKLLGKPIPLRFSGSLTSPSINLDLASVLQGQVRDRLSEEVLNRLEERDSDDRENGSEDGKPAGEAEAGEPESTEDQLKGEAMRRLLGGDDEEQAGDDGVAAEDDGAAADEGADGAAAQSDHDQRKADRQAERRKARREARQQQAEDDGG